MQRAKRAGPHLPAMAPALRAPLAALACALVLLSSVPSFAQEARYFRIGTGSRRKSVP